MQKLVILNGSGDTSVEFSKEDHTAAAEKFSTLMGTGAGHAFALDKDGNSKKIKEFDPEANEVIVVGPYVGG